MSNKPERVIVPSLVHRNALLMRGCWDLAVPELTPAERAAIIANTAVVDRDNLVLVMHPEDFGRKDQTLGALDLTNTFNTSRIATPLHPAISLHEEVVRWLETHQRADLSQEGRRLAGVLAQEHRTSLLAMGLPGHWPNVREDWEKAVNAEYPIPGYFNKRIYPRPGVSSEYIAFVMAQQAAVVPDMNEAAWLRLLSKHRELEGDEEKAQASARQELSKLCTQGFIKMHKWAELDGVIARAHEEKVAKPLISHAQAWVMTCKNLPKKYEEDLAKYIEGVRLFAEGRPPHEQMVAERAIETMMMTLLTPNAAEKMVGSISAAMEKVGTHALRAIAKNGVSQGKEAAEEMMLAGVGPGTKITYYAFATVYRLIGEPGTEVVEEKANAALAKMTRFLREHTQKQRVMDAFDEQAASRGEEILVRDTVSERSLGLLWPHFTPLSRQLGDQMAAIHEYAQNPESARKLAALEEQHGRVRAAAAVLRALDPDGKPISPELKKALSLDLPGEGEVKETAEKFALAMVAGGHFGEVAGYNLRSWKKGPQRLSHRRESYAAALKRNVAIAAAGPGSSPELLNSLAEADTLGQLSANIAEWVEFTAAKRPFMTQRGVSRLLTAIEVQAEEAGQTVESRMARGDWPAALSLSIGLGAGTITPAEYRTFVLEEQKLLQGLKPLRADESRARARTSLGETHPPTNGNAAPSI